MKHFTKLNMYKAANVTFNPTTMEAYSYGWWKFVAVIDGLVVFNSFPYSVSTRKHQAKVKNLMATLGIDIDLEFEAPSGFQKEWTEHSVHLYQSRIEALEIAINAPRSNKKKNSERLNDILLARKTISVINTLNKKKAA